MLVWKDHLIWAQEREKQIGENQTKNKKGIEAERERRMKDLEGKQSTL